MEQVVGEVEASISRVAKRKVEIRQIVGDLSACAEGLQLKARVGQLSLQPVLAKTRLVGQ